MSKTLIVKRKADFIHSGEWAERCRARGYDPYQIFSGNLVDWYHGTKRLEIFSVKWDIDRFDIINLSFEELKRQFA